MTKNCKHYEKSAKAVHLCLLVCVHPHPDVLLLAGRVPQWETDHLDKGLFGFTRAFFVSDHFAYFVKLAYLWPLAIFRVMTQNMTQNNATCWFVYLSFWGIICVLIIWGRFIYLSPWFFFAYLLPGKCVPWKTQLKIIQPNSINPWSISNSPN